MSSQKQNFQLSSHFLQLRKSKPITYGTHLKFPCFLILFLSSSAAAQQPPAPDQLSLGQPFNPTMAIVMVVLVCAFFVFGFFSIYIRQCIERRLRSSHGGSTATVGGPGDWSRRAPVGLDASVIDTFPTFLYSDVKGLKIGKGTLECAVCLNEFDDDQTLRLIPKCSHVFHPDCIDAWLASHVTCPVCRANLVPKPGDSPFSPVQMDEPDDSVEVDGRSEVNANDTLAPGELCIHVADDESTRQPPPETQSQEANLLYPVHQNRSIRSWSSRWRLREKLFPRSHSTGHSLIQPGENFDRFTLRLPEEVRSQILNAAKLNRTKSSAVFSRVRSSRRGYRSMSVGNARGRNYFSYERFDQEGRPDRGGFASTPPFLSRTGSVRSEKGGGAGDDQVGATPPDNFTRSVESLRMNEVKDKKDDPNGGEGSSDWSRPTS